MILIHEARMDILHDEYHIARKTYECDACNLFIEYGSDIIGDWIPREQAAVIKDALADGWKILPGQRYRKTVAVDNGVFYTYRGREDMDNLCDTYDLWPDND